MDLLISNRLLFFPLTYISSADQHKERRHWRYGPVVGRSPRWGTRYRDNALMPLRNGD